MTLAADRLRARAVLAALVLLPLAFWPWARDAYLIAKDALIALLALIIFPLWLLDGRPGWAGVPGWWRVAAGLWLAWVLVRAVGAADGPSAAVRTGEWGAVLMLAAGALGLAPRDRAAARAALIGTGATAALVGLGQHVFGRQLLSPYAVDERSVTFTEERVFSTFGNPIFFAGFLVLVLPAAHAALATALGAGRRGIAWLVGGAVLLMWIALALTGSRGGAIGLAAGFGMLAAGVPALRRRLAWFAGAAAAVALMVSAVRPGVLEHLLIPGDPGRLLMWKTAALMWREAPALGAGTGQFTQAYPCVQLKVATPGDAGFGINAVHAHDDYLEAFAELGWPGGVLFAAVFLGLLAWPVRDLAGWAVRAGVAAVAAHALFNFPLHTQPVMALAFLLPAIEAGPPPATPPRPVRPAAIAWLLLVLPLAAVSIRPFVRSCYFQWGLAWQDFAREEQERHSARTAEAYARSALNFDRALRPLPDGAHDRIAFHKGKMLFEAGDLAGAQKLFEADLGRFPCYPEGWGNLGVVYGVRAMNGDRSALPRAQELIQAALRVRPGGKEAASDYNSLGNVRLLAGNTVGALEAYRQSLACDPGFVEGAVNAVGLLMKRGRRNEAVAIVRAALAGKPGDLELSGLARRLRIRP